MRLAILLLFPAVFAGQSQQVIQERDKASLEGQVLNSATGLPLPKVRVTLRMSAAAPQTTRKAPGEPPTQSTTSGPDGKFQFVNLDSGDYQLTARRNNFSNASLGRGSSRKADPILLGAGDRKTGLTVKLIPFGAFAGKVVDEDGDAIQGMRVSAMTYQYTTRGRELVEIRNVTTDDLGEYRLFDIPAGKYVLKAGASQERMSTSEDDAETFSTTYYPNAQSASNAARMELGPSQQLSGLGLTMRKARFAAIRGRVIAPPLASVSVGLMTRSENGTSSSSHGLNDKDGKFELFGVPPGQVYLIGSYHLAGFRYNAQMLLDVGPNDINGVELRPLPPQEVRGSARIEGRATDKASEITVTLRSGGHNSSVGVGEDGMLLFRDLEPAAYHVELGHLQNLYIKSIQWGTADVTDGEIDLTNGVPARTELSVVLGADAGQIEGTVKDDKGDPADGAMVTLVPAGSRRYRSYYKTATADAAGRFLIRGVAPGSYKIYAWDSVNPNAVMYDPDFLRPFDGAAQLVEVLPNDKKTVDVKLILNQQRQ